ncbi:patatin-like phospholipase family protein [Acidiphilium sp. JA12-A1]|uniref:patatin-like phospholipase family protein n=1 Tax=Acidiphilium sp. JA12-A1 TaxID=1464546 RepID=UPI000461EEEC|nr:patatin-like phospholipase family protein [Acidiphilium sp. JA12-A1]KDM67989.1 patatin [Acidiphilium sp. JA12-A1]
MYVALAKESVIGERKRAFVALAGGGAKGLIHVGALRALEDRNVAFHGLAGTSAGAIVAALKAAGFLSRELLDPDGGPTLMDQLSAIDPEISRATDIFGKAGWARVLAFRWAAGHAWLLGLVGVLVAIALPTGLILAGASRSGPIILAVATVTILVAGLAILGARFLVGGLADVRRFRSALATLLQRKMFPEDPDRVVLMSDFGKDGRPTLKIVSANLSKRRLQLFSPERTPGVATADAVAASICLPIIFSPWRIDQSTFVDGGIVSNLPAWPFDEERELDPQALTIAVEIADTSNAPIVRRFNWLPSAVRTALFGSGELNLRVSGQAEQLVLESSLNLLQFDLTLEQARQEVRDGEAAALVRLDKRLFRRPELYRNACEVTRGLAEDVIESALDMKAKRVRVAIAVPDKDYHHSLRLRFSSGYEADADEAMLVPIVGSVLGEAWRARESRFELVPFPPEFDLPGDANRLRRNLRWPRLAWQLCIPISDDTKRARFTVQISGDAKLPAADPRLEDAITEMESSVKGFFNLIIQELSELEDDHGLEEHHL